MMHKFFLLEGARVREGVDALVSVVQRGIQLSDASLNDIELSQLHTKLSADQVNPARMSAFKHLNSSVGQYDSILESIAGESLRAFLGPDLLVQTKLNLSIQMPDDRSSQLDLHSDCWSGDSPFQVNLWIPLTFCFSSNSMFLLSEEKTEKCIRLVNDSPIVDRVELFSYVADSDFLNLNLGQAIIFNPGLIHGNVVNKTSQTRVSINVRFKSVFTPDASVDHISRSVGPYYRKFRLSEWTKLGVRLHTINCRALGA